MDSGLIHDLRALSLDFWIFSYQLIFFKNSPFDWYANDKDQLRMKIAVSEGGESDETVCVSRVWVYR